MAEAELQTIPARKGVAARVTKGQTVKVLNTHGFQIVDTWAFNADDLRECMSMEHCRVALDGLRPKVGDSLVTNQRRPILTFLEDTSPGVHDMLFAACDIYRYRSLGIEEYHDNCTDNLANAFKDLGLELPETPCPFNMFQNTWFNETTGKFDMIPPVVRPGDHVLMRAEMDLVVAFSACPMDVVPVNGPDGGNPVEAHFQVI
jgi:uncharacterized protein YcgI (DUF1989 family)